MKNKIFNYYNIFIKIIFAVILLLYTSNEIKINNISEVFRANGGAEDAVPSDVYNLALFIQELNIDTFSLRGSFQTNSLLFQRSIEYIYPIKYYANSKNVFILGQDHIVLDSCKKIDTYKGINYYECK